MPARIAGDLGQEDDCGEEGERTPLLVEQGHRNRGAFSSAGVARRPSGIRVGGRGRGQVWRFCAGREGVQLNVYAFAARRCQGGRLELGRVVMRYVRAAAAAHRGMKLDLLIRAQACDDGMTGGGSTHHQNDDQQSGCTPRGGRITPRSQRVARRPHLNPNRAWRGHIPRSAAPYRSATRRQSTSARSAGALSARSPASDDRQRDEAGRQPDGGGRPSQPRPGLRTRASPCRPDRRGQPAPALAR